MERTDYSIGDLSPHGLTKEERENPWQVINEFLSFSHLPFTREQLEELFHTTVTGNFTKMKRRERSDMVFFFQKLKKLVEANYLLGRPFNESYPDWKEKMTEYIKKSDPAGE